MPLKSRGAQWRPLNGDRSMELNVLCKSPFCVLKYWVSLIGWQFASSEPFKCFSCTPTDSVERRCEVCWTSSRQRVSWQRVCWTHSTKESVSLSLSPLKYIRKLVTNQAVATPLVESAFMEIHRNFASFRRSYDFAKILQLINFNSSKRTSSINLSWDARERKFEQTLRMVLKRLENFLSNWSSCNWRTSCAFH